MKTIIIHTDKYSGNFEREMCAFVTGHLRECGIGSEVVDPEIKKKFEGFIEIIEDDSGVMTPVELAPNPKYSNNGNGFTFDASDEKSTEEARANRINSMKTGQFSEYERCVQALEFYSQFENYDTSYYEQRKAICEKEIEEYSKIPWQELPSSTANNSVCIYVTDEITDELLDLAKARAEEYCKNEGLAFEGFEVEEDDPVVEQLESSGEMKVFIMAYKEHLIIETANPDQYDKDFTPVGGSIIASSIHNLFVDREEGAKLALEIGQVKKLNYSSVSLYSEDLY